MASRFVVTAWRDGGELLELRGWMFGSGVERRLAVGKVFAWRTRKFQIPLLLESTADIVDVVLQSEKGELGHNALRLLFAAAISRFITGLSDTLTDLTRLRPSWHPAGHTLSIPPYLLETRHRIVHRQMPSLTELKRAAQQSLDWLWEWYWSQLDTAFQGTKPADGEPAKGEQEVKGELQAILKSYVRARKLEIKATIRGKKMQSPVEGVPGSEAARAAVSAYFGLVAQSGAALTQKILLELLAQERAILPSNSSAAALNMDGAFLIWSPVLQLLSTPTSSFLQDLISRILQEVDDREAEDPVKEGLCGWLAEIATSTQWNDIRVRHGRGSGDRFMEKVLADCFCRPTPWSLNVVEKVLENGGVRDKEKWGDVLDAAKSGLNGEAVDMEKGKDLEAEGGSGGEDVAEEMEVEEREGNESVQETLGLDTVLEEKERGPRKCLGLWRPTPIGALPVGWENDE